MITQQFWLSLKPETRQKLREEFAIPRSSFSWVKGNELVQDGTTEEDLNSIWKDEFPETTEQMFINRAKEIELGEPLTIKVEPIIKTPKTNAKPIQKSKRKVK